MNVKRILTIIVIGLIAGAIWFIEFRKGDEVVTFSDETVKTGLVTTEGVSTGKKIGDTAPNWNLQTFSGDMLSLAEMRGSPVVVDFFADWCPFCHTEFPFIEGAHQMYKESDLRIVGIHRTDTESIKRGMAFIERYGTTFPIVADRKGDVYGAYTSGPAMPITFFIDRNGVIRDKILGPKTPEMLEVGISKILPHEE